MSLSNRNYLYPNKLAELQHHTSKTNTAPMCVSYRGNTPQGGNNMLAPNHARAKNLSEQIQGRMMKSMGVWENTRLPLQSHRQIHLSLSPPPSMTRHTVQYDQWCMLSLCAWQHLFHTSLTCVIQYYRAPITSLLQCVNLQLDQSLTESVWSVTLSDMPTDTTNVRLWLIDLVSDWLATTWLIDCKEIVNSFDMSLRDTHLSGWV